MADLTDSTDTSSTPQPGLDDAAGVPETSADEETRASEETGAGAQPKAELTRAHRVLRAVLGVLLLLGPLLATELYMHRQAQWLRPVLRRFTVAMDMKLLFIENREGCPDLVTFGTSLTDQGVPPRYLAKYSLAGEAIEDPFDFSAAEVRVTNILAQYRWLRQRGCKPRWILVEVSPIVINGEHGGPLHDPALMSARAQLGMPEGFAELRDYTLAHQLELATYERLLVYRRREQIIDRALNQYEGETWFMSERERESEREAVAKKKKKPPKRMKDDPKLEFDGKMTRMSKSLDKRSWAREQRKRRGMYARGIYKWKVNQTEKDALWILTREAAAEGVGVILQAPPVTDTYHSEVSPKLGMAPDFEAFMLEVQAIAEELPGVVWINAHADPSYEVADFADWVHLSKRGARRYTKELIGAANEQLEAERGER